MLTIMLLLTVGMLALAVTPWIGYLNHSKLHHTDSMAGDGGED
jgi:hypothetical protein